MKNVTVSGVKAQARRLIGQLAKNNLNISLAQALEAVSAMNNGSDWNRYQTLLKSRPTSLADSPSNVQPHRLIVSNPGHGSGTVLRALFQYESLHTDTVPVVISARANLLQTDVFDKAGYIEIGINLKEFIVSGKLPLIEYSDNIKGVSIWIDSHGMGAGVEWERRARLAEKAFTKVLGELTEWLPTKLLRKIGTLIVDGLEYIETEHSSLYDVLLPNTMANLNAHGVNKKLVALTWGDAAQSSLYKSKDEYKLIRMHSGLTRYFPDCPLDTTIFNVVKLTPWHLKQNFSQDNRVVEDIALFVSASLHCRKKSFDARDSKLLNFLTQYREQLSIPRG